MKILWLKTELLHPIDKGGRIRSYQMLKHLKARHNITYLSFSDQPQVPENLELSSEYCHRLVTVPWQAADKYSTRFYIDLTLNLASSLPYAIQKYRSEAMARQIERVLTTERHDLIVSDFLTPSVNLPRGIQTPSLLFQHNVESAIWERHYQSTVSTAKRAYFYRQFQKMAVFEGDTIRRFDAVVAVSESDRRLMTERFEPREIFTVPTGVDTEFFSSLDGVDSNPHELVFTGSMDYLPNEDAVLYFVNEVLPLIRKTLPEVSLTIAGRNPTRKVERLAVDPRIQVTGTVADIRPYLERARAVVVPIRIGGGTRLKIFEAMSMGRAVISTSIGAEGLPVTSGVNILIADNARDFASKTVSALSDAPTRESLTRHARELVASRFGWEAVAAEFSKICEDLASGRKHSRAA